ncbi:hypothetical protein P0O24_00040 [Methanotrichaceae archaeon M04Ac]|uniref:Uncharacterized protein n=1 Tax=Candidatus Methanocrinis alkalitolerans TaxID=3033395 RepID=A0ABT5XB79_9EURY|nr:hypothetical protein [Candidatus Methanocrinis alkalitolerans]MDF0591976.1 hypothetical protein [Candidatus Methanocrinis alkalitolerans]
MTLADLVMPVTADRLDDLILDLKFGAKKVREEPATVLGEIGDPKPMNAITYFY